ncbi:MAG: Maf family protein [Sandaracinaceae bacterium]|nr:Maf family protein [Sandaracinaceae bacterium]
MPELVLASASPRRREILETLRIAFRVRASAVPEDVREGEAPRAIARRRAGDKALEVSNDEGRAFVLGADTIVVADDQVLGKPRDDRDAERMIARLSGRWHEVITGVALAKDGALLEAIDVVTKVCFRALDEATVRAYVASGEGRDKAGAYAVQGLGAGLVCAIEGSYGNVVGLPAVETLALLQRHGAIEAWP